MILFVAIDLKLVCCLGRKLIWPKPALCPRCRQSHLWGYGFADTFFDGFTTALPMRRYLCPACGCVIKCRPKGYFARFQCPIKTIRSRLHQRIVTGCWPQSGHGGRGRYWLTALRRQVLAYLGHDWLKSVIDGFDRLRQLGMVPVSWSI